jgi:hypothetical protein
VRAHARSSGNVPFLGAEFHDEADVRDLLRYLNIVRYEAALAVITRYSRESGFHRRPSTRSTRSFDAG